jgi:hypothetical protein
MNRNKKLKEAMRKQRARDKHQRRLERKFQQSENGDRGFLDQPQMMMGAKDDENSKDIG